MKRRLVLRRIAEREFDDAKAWYENQSIGLGEDFRAVIMEYLERIAADPERFPEVWGNVRRAVVLRRFHYVIHYLIEPEQIVILSIFHTSRAPEQLVRRR